jgi:hypothetical protein
VNESLWQFELILGLVCVAGALWLATTGRLIGGRATHAAERFGRAGAMACLGVALLSQAAQHWTGHQVQLDIAGLVAVTAALGLGFWSWVARLGSRGRGGV